MCTTRRDSARIETPGVGASIRIPLPEDARRVDVHLGIACDVGWAYGSETSPIMFGAGVRLLSDLQKPCHVRALVLLGLGATSEGFVTWEVPASPCATCKGG